MRLLSILAALLLLIGAGSCSGSALKGSETRDTSTVFTLSDSEIDAFEASPEPDWRSDISTGTGRLAVPPAIFADVSSSATGAIKGVSSSRSNGCGKCKYSCGKCNHKYSCKCHGDCKKCGKCKSSCGKCNHKYSCSCHGKCKQKCDSCKDKCGKCSHDGNCGCHGKCKHKCDKCTSGCGVCSHDGNCGCKGKCKQSCGHCKSRCTKCKHNGCCTCNSCCVPPPCPCDVKCKSMSSIGEASFEKDCNTGTADATYKVHLTFTDCPNVDNEALGHEVVFTRNGIDIGTATTDINGDAWITDLGLQPGTYNIRATSACCFACFDVCVKDKDCCQVECLSAENTGEGTFQADCATHCADVTYSVHLAYNDCPNIDDEALGHDVVFSRNGVEVGHGTTDINGDASFTETCVGLGDYDITAVSDDCSVEFPVNVYEDCCKEECTGMDNDTQRFFLADCYGTTGTVDLNVHLNFSECPGRVFDKSGFDVVFTADGNEIGTAQTDADGDASFEWHNVALGNHHITAVAPDAHAAVVVPGGDVCATEFDITVWDECGYHACIAGKGKLNGKNGSPYFVFQYEGHVRNGVLEMANTMSGNDGSVNFVNTPIEWIVVLGLEIYFGNDNIMFHTIDNGKAPGVDFAEVWVFDQNYHNSGLLLNGQIRSSWGLQHP